LKSKDDSKLDWLFLLSRDFYHLPNPWSEHHLNSLISLFKLDMPHSTSTISVESQGSYHLPDVDYPENRNAGSTPANVEVPRGALSPNTVLTTLTANQDIPHDSLCDIAVGLCATVNMANLSHQSETTTLHNRIDKLQDQVNTERERCKALEDETSNNDFDYGPLPFGFIRNKGRAPDFDIPVGGGNYLPVAFICHSPDNPHMVYRVTGRFGEDEPQYTHELFATPSLTDNSPVHPLPNWFVMYLHGRSGEYTTLFEAVRTLHPWGIVAEIACHQLPGTVRGLL
jgi:hypothetical protein